MKSGRFTGAKLGLGAAALLLQAGPAVAQQQVADTDLQTMVRAGERCPEPDDEEAILVCGRRQHADGYRLPVARDGFDPSGPIDSVSRERHRLYEVGASGIGSCSTTGPGGYTGCDLIRWKDAKEQHADRKAEASFHVGPFKLKVDD